MVRVRAIGGALNLNVGCGTHYAEGWVNTDVITIEDTQPDVLQRGHTFPFRDGAFERVYLGHILEHVPWLDVPPLLDEVRRVLEPGGEVLATGPDVYRAIKRWHDDLEPWWLVEDVLEGMDKMDATWPEAVHKWNCYEFRLVTILERTSFVDVAPAEDFAGWPVVNWSDWQCAVQATKAG